MKNISLKKSFKSFFIFFLILNVSNQQRIYPDTFINRDFIYPENDILKNEEYSLIEAKVLTKEEITLYLKKQGIHLTYDYCCRDLKDVDVWDKIKTRSDYEEVYRHAKYNDGGNEITYNFPVQKIDNKGYSVYHKLWLFNPITNGPQALTIKINYSNNNTPSSFTNNVGEIAFITMEIKTKSNDYNEYDNYITIKELERNVNFVTNEKLNGEISSITFSYSALSYSPAIALHWTYYKVIIAFSNFSLRGNSLCDKTTNPCISGYYCIGGVCKKCHPSCYDCVNGGLSTDCYSKCSSHSALMTPNKGTCNIGYVDLNQFEDFDIEDIIPPPRNNRLTISFWMYLNYFPETVVEASIINSFHKNIYIFFDFSPTQLIIKCGNNQAKPLGTNALNTWIFTKCAISFDHEDENKEYLYYKYYTGTAYDYDLKYYTTKSENRTICGHDFKKYYEPDDYISLHFYKFNQLSHSKYTCNVFMKEFVVFREYLPEPYDNKYFSVEKLLTSTLELPEILFIIPFDELKREGNKYKVKCFSYPENIEENEIILSPKESGDFTLYPPKLFKRLELLEKNKKYKSTDLLQIEDIPITDASKIFIASYDNVPLSCVDENFLYYDTTTLNVNDVTTYKGECKENCQSRKSMIFGLGDRKGFCNYDCDKEPHLNSNCLTSGSDLLQYKSKFECTDTNNFYNIFYKCENKNLEEQKKNIFYYDPNYSPANIVIDVRTYNLQSYVIEFWYYFSDCVKITSGYIFYSNQIQVQKIEGSYNIYTAAHGVLETTIDTIVETQWNQIVFEVYYDPREERNYKTRVYLQTNLNTGNAQVIDFSENPYPLEYIYFCNGRRASCNNLELNWFCGYYKNLRLFNGELSQRHVTFRFDEYYGIYPVLLSSIILYLPLYGDYISNNILRQYEDKLDFLTVTSTTNTWNYPQYNYCLRPDNTCASTSNPNCQNCFNKDQCYKCKTNMFLTKLKGGITNNCESESSNNKKYVLKLPIDDEEFEINHFQDDTTNKYHGVTVNFFIKLYGFKIKDKIDIIYLSDNLKISYNSNFNDLYFGLNLISHIGTSETIISNYYDFRKHFGVWTFISVATYNKANDNFFPAMVRFEINSKKMPIILTSSQLDNLYINKITFSNQIFALIQRIKVYKTYIIGALAFETHAYTQISNINIDIYNYLPSPDKEGYFKAVKEESDCSISGKIIKTKGTGNTYECVPDNDEQLINFEIGNKNKYLSYFNESRTEIQTCNGECDLCIEKSKYNCSCNFDNKNEKIFLGNLTDHFCKKLDYINFATLNEIGISTPLTKSAGEQFTLHFWVFAYSYIENVFKGLEVEWQGYTTVQVKLDSTQKYYFKCLVNGNTVDKSLDFYMNQWNFLHCAVDYNERKVYMTTEEESYEIDYEGGYNNAGVTNLIIRDLTVGEDWGVLFYKHIRLWKDAFQYSSFLSRIEIKNNYFSTSLLYQFDTKFNLAHKACDIKQTSTCINVVYVEEYKIGTNIVPEDIYNVMVNEPILCNENGQYYDRKTFKCVKFEDISNVNENLIFDDIDVAYSHNYAMSFWILLEEHTDITKPINFDWENHMKISLQYDNSNNTFNVYCFPQNYFPYSKTIADTTLTLKEKTSQVLNSVTNIYDKDLGGKWLWFQCSLSYNNRLFYLNENQKTLITETLYMEGTNEFKNDEPLGYFFNGISSGAKSKLTIEQIANRDSSSGHKKIYLRCFYLFKDYLPFNYNYKYMDMYRIDKEQFPPLTFAINFALFEADEEVSPETLTFRYRKYSSLENLISPGTITLSINNPNSKELSANFIFLPLCNPLDDEKYDSSKQLCQEIYDCDKVLLNALYCMEEKTPLICKTNYYINIDSTKDDAVECLNYCQGRYYRSPGTLPTQGICGTDCFSVDILKTCPNTAASILNYQNDFECLTGFTRIGYQCFNGLETPNQGALFYSGINYPYNIYQSFTNDFLTLIGSGYVLEFWFMIDNVVYNKTNFVTGKKYHYFNAKPHEVYVEKNGGTLNYKYAFNSNEKIVDISDVIEQYEWNKIVIFADATISGKKTIRLYVNFDKEKMESFDVNSDLTLTYIAFCSNDPDINLNYPECVSRGKKVNWASAYYNVIRLWNIWTSTVDTIQSFINGIYSEYPQSILLFYPLTIQYLDNNVMTNIMENLQEHISFKCPSGARCTLYNKDNIIIYNYSSKFDWGLLHPNQFVANMNSDYTMNIVPGTCDPHCIRCFKENDINHCYECEEGYILKFKECKKATEFYFLKTPSGTVDTPYNFVIENEEEKEFTSLAGFTIVFWMKFFGVKYSTVTEYCRILSLDQNTYLAFQRSTNNLVVLENSKIVFRDTNFQHYFGIWIPISIANYVSGAQSEIYPNMFTLSVNKIDIPFSEGYSIPSTGIKVTQLQFGYEIIALFAQLSIYSKFIQGGYGRIRSTIYKEDLFYYKNLTGTSSTNCIDVSTDLISTATVICAPDYNVNFMEQYYCNDDNKYYNPYDSNNEEITPDGDKCKDCDPLCNTLCFLGGTEECTCDMTEGKFWLRRNVNFQTFCEHIPNLDFGNLKPYTFTNAPMSKTKEYTIEFWLFIYSYNTVTMNFKTLWIEWNYHNRLKLYNEQNALKVDCQPLWHSGEFDTVLFPDVKASTLKYYQWNYVKCGTDLKNKKYFLNTITEYALKAKEEYYWDLKQIDITATEEEKYFTIYRSSDFLINFGYIFIRELKLWQQYNKDFIDIKNIYFNMETKTTVADLKRDFPGLLLYYVNKFDLDDYNNPKITEIITGDVQTIARDPNYVGYNIVDPERKGYAPTLQICEYGQLYNDLLLNKCICSDGSIPTGPAYDCPDIDDELCQVYSNLEEQCLQCREDNVFLNKWIDEFEETCYLDCPATTYGDPLMNQCRRCHETCYTCYNDLYNNCKTCTGELYFNPKEDTCIPNCQAAGLTRSLTKPNLCVVFDADASLVNVNTLTPIDIHTFDYIEALVIQPTSTEYKTLWLFDANQTNIVNRELGLTDDIPLTATPFTGRRDQLRAELDHEFFRSKHKYVFGLKIYVEKEGLEVPIYVWWTLTMNSPPYGGKVTVMPYLGLYNTTTFIMRCVDYEDENTPVEDLEYDFYYIEANTNSKIKLSRDFSLNNEVYSNFTVRYYQLEYSNVTIYCQVRDKFGDIEESSAVITIVNQKDSPLYVLKQIVDSFYITTDPLTDIQLLARAEVLMSLGIRPYTDKNPNLFFTTYSGSITGEKVEKKDPYCVAGYCSDHGDCEVIDVALTCKCVATYIGKECFLDKDGYTDLAYNYKTLYTRLIDRLILGNTVNEPINEIVFTAFYRLFFAAQKFFQEDSFFETNLIELKTYLKEEINYIITNEDRVNKLFDLNDFYYTYFYIKETQLKLKNKIENNYPFRNRTLDLAEYLSYKDYFQTLFDQIDDDTVFLIKNYKKDYKYTCQHFIYHLKKIDETFNDENFFESLKTVYVTYKPIIFFMKCLKEKHPTFNYYFSYIEYLVNPLSYEAVYYPNITSPLISIKIYDLDGHEITIRNCPSYAPIKIHLPFNSYDWMNYINEQKWLFLPENYKLENDPIFRDPIFIWDNGSVSDDTVEQRIAKYYRYYNIVGLVHTPTSLSLYEYTSFLFKNISDAFLLMFETNHLSSFTSMIIPNIMNFVVDGRFYYLPRYKVLLCFQNHIDNGAFYIWAVLLFLFISISIYFYFYDYTYFDNIDQLEFLQKEIVKVHFPYGQLKPGLNDENIYNLIPKESKLQKKKMKGIKNMFHDYDMDDKKEKPNEESEENNDEFSLNEKITENINSRMNTFTNEKPSSRREIVSKNNKKSRQDEDDEKEKETEIRTHKKKNKNLHRKIKSIDDKSNPPRRNRKYEDEDDEEKQPDKTTQIRRKESSKNNNDDDVDLKDINKTFSKKSRANSEVKSSERSKKEKKIEKDENGYGDGEEDFNENNIIENFIKSEKETINTYASFAKNTNQNFALKTIDSKGFSNSKYTKGSRRSKKNYFYDKDKILANYISLQRFHNRAGRTNVDNDGIPLDIINEEEERKKALESFTRLSLTPLAFFKYNVKSRHILIAPFLNLTLFNNRWKKLMVLLTQFYIQQLAISLILTLKESIVSSNVLGIIATSLIAAIASDVLVYCFVFLFGTSTYQRKRLYRLVMMGERLYVIKAWNRLKRTMNFSFFFGFLIAMAFWSTNCYISLIFTAVWKFQRSAWIICFILTLFFDLVGGELLTEGMCAYFYSKRVNSEFFRNLAESLNRLRCYRTMWP